MRRNRSLIKLPSPASDVLYDELLLEPGELLLEDELLDDELLDDELLELDEGLLDELEELLDEELDELEELLLDEGQHEGKPVWHWP